MQPQRILILGTGVVGQIFGGMLHRAGHLVTFFTRPDRVDTLRTEGIRLMLRKNRTELRISGLRATEDILLFDEYDWVLVCFRGEQVDEAEALLTRRSVGPAQIVWCMPLWPQHAEELAARVPRSHYLMPGVSGVYRPDHIEAAIRRTELAPLGESDEADSRALASLLTAAGLPARLRRALPERIAGGIAILFPLLLGLATEDWRLPNLRRNKARLRLVHAAQVEALQLLAAEGVQLPRSTSSYGRMHPALFTAAFRVVTPCLPAFARDMLTVHFRKTHAQQIAMLRDLCARAPSGNAPVLHQLIALAEAKERTGPA